MLPVEPELTAEVTSDSVISQAFANLINQANGDPSLLEKYPLDPHELEEYGDSIRVRRLPGDTEEKPAYLVYREDLYLIPQAEAAAYTVTRSEDGRTAVITPALPEEALEGKTGIVLLGTDIEQDKVMLFDGEPVRSGEGTLVTLVPAEEVSLNRIFSDGQFTTSFTKAEPDSDFFPTTPGRDSALIFRTVRAARVQGNVRGLTYTEQVNETNLTGTVSYNTSDFKLDGSFKVDPWELDFGLNIDIAAKAYFDLTSSGTVSRKNIFSVDVPLYSEGLFGCNLHYMVRAQFNEVPVHVKGRIDNSVTYVFGIIGATLQNFRGPVTFETAELVHPERDKNKDAHFTIGSEMSTSADFAELSLNLYFYKIQIGPIFSLSIDLSADNPCTLRLNKDIPIPEGRTAESIHECTVPGNDGCYTLTTRESTTQKFSLKVDVYFKSWKWSPIAFTQDRGSKQFYNSLPHNTGLKEGVCPHILYRIPVEVRKGTPYYWTPAGDGFRVYCGVRPDVSPAMNEYMEDVTDADSRAVIYLPYQEKHRYELLAAGPLNEAGYGKQPHDMRKRGNETVIIYVNDMDTVNFQVNKIWEIDANGQEMPEQQPGYVVQQLNPETGKWEITLFQGEPVTVTLQYMSRVWTGSAHAVPMYRKNHDTGEVELIQYRLRELAGSAERFAGESVEEYTERLATQIIYDVGDPEWDASQGVPLAAYKIPEYLSATSGELVPEHQGLYTVRYDTYYGYEGNNTVTVTNTAVEYVHVSKLWDKIAEEDRPGHVYLALQSKPENGWDKRAETENILPTWKTVTDPVLGPVLDLNDLIGTGEMVVEVPRLKSIGLAAARLTPENGWGATWLVKKYNKGILMAYQAAELDSGVARTAVTQEYGFDVEVDIKQEKEYLSVPGRAHNLANGWDLYAAVVNAPDRDSYTIGGVKYWVPTTLENSVVPEYVRVVITDPETGLEVARVTVPGPEDLNEVRMQPWTLTSKDLDPDVDYIISEELPEEVQGKYYCIVSGYDLINTWVGNERGDIRIRKEWDPLYLQLLRQQYGDDRDPPDCQITATVGGRRMTERVSARDGSEWLIEGGAPDNLEDLQDPSLYSVEETGIPFTGLSSPGGTRFVPVYSGPILSIGEDGKAVYTFTVTNMLQFEYTSVDVLKVWDDELGSRSTFNWPEYVTVKWLRNGEVIAQRRNDTSDIMQDYSTVLWHRTGSGATMRLDENGVPYYYTVIEEMEPAERLLEEEVMTPDGGFVSSLNMMSLPEEQDVRYYITNRWVPGAGADQYVDVKGTKRWKTEPYPANGSFRPDSVTVYILNDRDELAGMALCEYSDSDRAWIWSAKNLPRYYEDGEEISYHILEKRTDGYTAFYDEPVFDGETLTWTCNMENRLGFAYLTVNKRVLGGEASYGDIFKFRMTFFSGFGESERRAPKLRKDIIEVWGESSERFDFLLNDEGVFLYLLEEVDTGDPKYQYDTDVRGIFLVVTKGSDGIPEGRVYLLDGSADVSGAATFEELLSMLPDARSQWFRNRLQDVKTVEKKWEIDLEDRDRPDSVQIAFQKKVPGSFPERWETVSTAVLTAEEGWKKDVGVPVPDENNPVYRVREMTEDGEIVYDPADADAPENSGAGFVDYAVPEYESVLAGGTVPAHRTKYSVSYGRDGEIWTVTNTAVNDVDVTKRWILLSDDEETPDLAWVALLYKPSADAMQNAEAQGADLSGLEDAELPVINPVSGGTSPANLVTELALGVSTDIFSGKDALTVAVAKVSEENNWTAHFTDKKYTQGIPVEYTGAELGSEIIRQVFRAAAGFNLAVSYNPFEDFISIPGKAYSTVTAWGLADLDASVLEKLVKAGRTLTAEDLEKLEITDGVLSDWKLWANVINVQIDIKHPPEPDPGTEPPDPEPVTGVKHWKNDTEDTRPATLTIHVREKKENDEGEEEYQDIPGSPVTLNKSAFAGQDDWTWRLEGEGVDGSKDYEVSEEYSGEFTGRDHYLGEVVDYEIINTWSDEEIVTVRVSGTKTWDDEENKAKKRPERITVELQAKTGDGEWEPATRPVEKNGSTVNEAVKPVETSEEGGWKYFFTDLPRYRTVDGEKKEISYSVKEKEIEGYTAEYADPVFDEPSRNWDCDITNKLDGYGDLKIEKDWDIDFEGKDRPDSIEVAVQKKTGDGDDEKWETVKVVELNKDGDWKSTCYLPVKQKKEGSEDETEDIVYRVRELKEEEGGILKILQDKVNEYAGHLKEKYDEWIGDIKTNARDLFDNLPDDLKEAADENIDKLAEKLDVKVSEVYEKLLEKLQFYSAGDRIVYDKDDKDKPKKGDDDDKEPETNVVTFKVAEYDSVLTGEKVDAHETKYKVSYKKKDGGEGEADTYTIGNQAILETDVVKRWIKIGDADDDDKPENVYLVLLFKLDEDVVERAGSAASELSSYTNIELPVFNLLDGELFTSGLISGGMNPITLISELVIGVDIDVFNIGDKILKVAVAKVSEDDDWTAHFVTSKYMLGVPVEFKGAELGSEIIRQIVKYILQVDVPFSYTPFGNYFSIPGKAYGNLVDVSQISDLFNLDDSSFVGKLAKEALDFVIGKLNDLIKEIAPDGLPIGLDDWEQVANVINILFDFDLNLPVSGQKIWVNDREEDRPEYLTITVKQGDEVVYTTQISAENDWSWSFDPSENEEEEDGEEGGKKEDNGSDDDYIVEEEYPEDYPEEKKNRYTLSTSGYDLINTWDNVTVAGMKIWEDDNDRDGLRPETLTVRLLADGEPATREIRTTNEETGEVTTETKAITVETSAEGRWKYSFPNLPKYKVTEGTEGEERQEIVYTVEETEVPEGYESRQEGSNIVNTHIPETLDGVTVEKVWDDDGDRDGLRPESVTVKLLANGEEAASADEAHPATPTDISEENGWKFTYTGLYKYEDGEEIEYTADEEEVPEGYEKSVDGLVITNRHEPERFDVTVEKKWEDGDDADGLRPDSVTVSLKANGATPTDLSPANLATPTDIGEEEEWKYTFTGVLKYHEGEEIEYTADEEEVPEGYEKSVDGLTVTNTHEFEKITVSGTKVWQDGNVQEDQDGIRPDEITVILLANGEKVDEQTVSADGDGNWEFSFEDLPAKEKGEPIAYTVDEEPVPGYDTEITGDLENGFTITNTHIPGTITICGEKIWEDDGDRDGIRPESVLVTLFWKGAKIDNRNVTAEQGWKFTFANVDAYFGGNAADWELKEYPVPDGYTVSYSEPVEKEENVFELNVINTHEPERTDVTVRKTWEDDGDRDGIRPDSVTVILKANGATPTDLSPANLATPTDLTAADAATPTDLSEADSWEHTFTNVLKYHEGKEIEYTVDETEVPEGYEKELDGLTVINRHEPETVTVSGKKFWDDDDDHDGLRPESVTVVLYKAGGGEAGRKTVTAEDGWEYSFTVLKNEAGSEISYTVSEDPIPEGYVMNVSGYNITNTHVPETITISGEKFWEDDDDRDGRRPESITVNLYADDKLAGSKTVSEGEDHRWTYTFYNMPKYRRGGVKISYVVSEDTVLGYYPVISGWNITNVHVPATKDISGEKYWDDRDDWDGIRPEEITVILYGGDDGPVTKTVKADKEGRWRYTFANQYVYSGGSRISYTVSENPIPDGYVMDISGYNITNTHVPEKIAISGRKIWEDNDDALSFRPESVTVHLLADGTKAGSKTVTAEDGWEYSFMRLDREKDGKEIEYSITEDPVPEHYRAEISGYDVINTLNWAKYRVEWYYQENGVYPETPNAVEERSGEIGTEVSVTDEDKQTGRERYSLDETAANVFTGEVAEDGSLTLKVYFRPYYIITYDPNGGRLEGSTKPVSSKHMYGEVITIREEPVRGGYEFLYWKGSVYAPGEFYTVTEDHTFVAQWKSEFSYKFTFTKQWIGAHGDSINWTLYDSSDRVVHKKFNKKVISDLEWRYEAWFSSDAEYYIVEDVPTGFKVRYENVGAYADVRDRCYNGGTIINYKIPKTGDTTGWPWWIIPGLLGIAGAVFVILHGRRRSG